MRRIVVLGVLAVIAAVAFTACNYTGNTIETAGKTTESDDSVSAEIEQAGDGNTEETDGNFVEADNETNSATGTAYTVNTAISEVINDPVFGDYGRLIFPADDGYYSGNTLGDLRMTWYSKGEPGAKFAVCNVGGGFAYVGAMHDSFPHALELSKKGYNAFALVYRPGAQTACEDLARAISFIFDHAGELEVDTGCYSLWGGSAGGRMTAYLETYGPEAFGGENLPRPGAIIMQYTGHSEYSENDPPTYACVGENDGIASWRTMERRLDRLSELGIDAEFHKYPGLSHGFGLGIGTVAEGWINDAAAFWERQGDLETE